MFSKSKPIKPVNNFAQLAKSAAILPEIRTLIATSCCYIVASANLALITCNWHIRRVIISGVS